MGKKKKKKSNKKTALKRKTGSILDRYVQEFHQKFDGKDSPASLAWINTVLNSINIAQFSPEHCNFLIKCELYRVAIKTSNLLSDKDASMAWEQMIADHLPLTDFACTDAEIQSGSRLFSGISIVRNSLELYSKQDFISFKAEIRKIGVRSPYRNWRMLLQAIMAYHSGDDEMVRQSLEKIPTGSALQKIGKIYNGLIQIKNGSLPDLQLLSRKQLKIAEEIAGSAVTNLHRIQRASRFIDDFSLKMAEINISKMKYPENVKRKLKEIAFRIMLCKPLNSDRPVKMHTIARKEILNSQMGKFFLLFSGSTSQFYCMDISDYFEQRDNLLKTAGFPVNSEGNLHLAAIYRHWMGIALEMIDHGVPENFIDDELDIIGSEFEKIFRNDPHNLDDAKMLLKYYFENRSKKVTNLLEKLLERFPDEPSLFRSAAAAANNRKSFIKALKFVEIAIPLDPLNKELRRLKHNILKNLVAKRLKKGELQKAKEEMARWESASNSPKDLANHLFHVIWFQSFMNEKELVKKNLETFSTLFPENLLFILNHPNEIKQTQVAKTFKDVIQSLEHRAATEKIELKYLVEFIDDDWEDVSVERDPQIARILTNQLSLHQPDQFTEINHLLNVCVLFKHSEIWSKLKAFALQATKVSPHDLLFYDFAVSAFVSLNEIIPTAFILALNSVQVDDPFNRALKQKLQNRIKTLNRILKQNKTISRNFNPDTKQLELF